MKKYYHLSIITLSVIFVTGISLALAQSWEAPEGPPPGNNTLPSINVGDLTQTKLGNLWAVHLLSDGDVYAHGSVVAPNTEMSNTNTRILTIAPPDDDSSPGEFRWREAGSWAGGTGGATVGGYERIQGLSTTHPTPSIAQCSIGKKIIGGGCGPGGSPSDFNFGYGYPNTDDPDNHHYWCNNPAGDPVVAYAICICIDNPSCL
jgi:hypothetical protein